jgi:hypothetical protein
MAGAIKPRIQGKLRNWFLHTRPKQHERYSCRMLGKHSEVDTTAFLRRAQRQSATARERERSIDQLKKRV